jgi:hypothetical protein
VTLKVLRREGSAFEGQLFVDKERYAFKIEGNVDHFGTITWNLTANLEGDFLPGILGIHSMGKFDSQKRIRVNSGLILSNRFIPMEMILVLQE